MGKSGGKEKWTAGGARIGTFPALHLGGRQGPDSELCLAGQYGEVWPNGQGYKALVVGAAACRRLNEAGVVAPLLRGDEEAVIRFEAPALRAVLRALKYSSRRPTQVKYANKRSEA